MLPIFTGHGKDGKDRNLATKINTLFPFDVSMNDGLPKQVCYLCAYKLEIFYGFYTSCLRSHNKLKDYLVTRRIPEITIEDDEPENQQIKIEDSQQTTDLIVPVTTECQNQCNGISPSNAPVPGNVKTDVNDNENSPEDERCSSDGDLVLYSSTTDSVQETEPQETTQSLEETRRHDNCNETVPPSHAHNQSCSSESVLNCRYCNKVFYEIRTLHAHEKLHNGGILLYSCRTCGKEFYSDSDLKIHVNTSCAQEIHNDSQATETCAAHGTSFPCRVCNKILRSAASLLKHKESRQHLMRLKKIDDESVKSSAQRLLGKTSKASTTKETTKKLLFKASKTREITKKSLVIKDKLVPHSACVSNYNSAIHQLKRKSSSSVANPAVVKKGRH
ncbi:uncharacterized protein [Anabrus simplex]|uniref:uncharacterized protein n=1 Tax=Anabrus simplex TaxID=316456 RepID=UPI0034DCFA41